MRAVKHCEMMLGVKDNVPRRNSEGYKIYYTRTIDGGATLTNVDGSAWSGGWWSIDTVRVRLDKFNGVLGRTDLERQGDKGSVGAVNR